MTKRYKHNKERKRRNKLNYFLLLFFVTFIIIAKYIPAVGEFYAAHLYPTIASVITFFTFYIPVSLYDLFITAALCYLFYLLLVTIFKRISVKEGLRRFFIFGMWLFVGFYMTWGINYFRYNFYQRNHIEIVKPDEKTYYEFASDYIKQLNKHYVPYGTNDPDIIAQEVALGYKNLQSQLSFSSAPWLLNSPKTMLYSNLMSKMGIKGYIGAYFNEPTLNNKLLPVEYAATYAHEMAHIMGISSEAEANLYAYLVCTGSTDPQIQYSGYLSLFGYVMSNAKQILPKEKYEALQKQISPSVIENYQQQRRHWNDLYSPTIGEVQDKLYDLFLKGNHISSGVLNYSEVIGYILALNQRVNVPE